MDKPRGSRLSAAVSEPPAPRPSVRCPDHVCRHRFLLWFHRRAHRRPLHRASIKSAESSRAFPFCFLRTAPPLSLYSCTTSTLVLATLCHSSPPCQPPAVTEPGHRLLIVNHVDVKPPAVVLLQAHAPTWLCSTEDLTIVGLHRPSSGPTSSMASFDSLRSTSVIAQDRVFATPFGSSLLFPTGRRVLPWTTPSSESLPVLEPKSEPSRC
jgi:hypothetical protein